MTDENEQLVLQSTEGQVRLLTLNRPEKSNALSTELVAALSTLLAEAEGDSEINVVVITGAGKSFSAGLDLESLATWTIEQKTEYLGSVFQLFRRIWSLSQPVIAAVNGPAIAGGFDLAAFCDIRLASRRALFGQAEVKLGLTQIVYPLYKTIGLARAKELALTGDNISADEAYRIGLANHLCEPDELMARTMELAGTMAGRPRNALIETKRLTRELIDKDTATAFREMAATIIRCLATDEHKETVAEYYDAVRNRGR